MRRINFPIWRISKGFYDFDIYFTKISLFKEKIIELHSMLTSCGKSCDTLLFIGAIIQDMPYRKSIVIRLKIVKGVRLQFTLGKPLLYLGTKVCTELSSLIFVKMLI